MMDFSNSPMDSPEDVRRDPVAQPVPISSDSGSTVGSAAKVAGSRSLRRLKDKTGAGDAASVRSADDTTSVHSRFIRDVALPVSAATSLQQLQDQLQNAATSPHADRTQQHAHAGDFPLPDSPSGSSAAAPDARTEEKKNKGKSRAKGDPVSYTDLIQPLIRCMPHLFSLHWANQECRNMNAGAVSLLDFYGTLTDYEVRIVKQPNVPWLVDRQALRLLTEKPAKDITSKLIIVEDLSPDTIEALGPVLHIDPEAFALQLSRGRFSNNVYGTNDHEGRWNTSGMATSKASIQWYRPVKLGPGVAAWLKDLASLSRLLGVASGVGEEEGEEEEEEVCLSWFEKQVRHWKRDQDGTSGISGSSRFVSQKDIHHKARITSNIFRRSRLLSTRVAETSNERRAWEERATIFKVEDAHVPTLILLVDPMPTITDLQIVTETRLRLNPVPTSVTKEPTRVEQEVEVFLPSGVRVPFQLPANKLNTSEDEMQHLRQASEATSTAAAVQSWLAVMHNQTNPVLALLEVVRVDSIAFFDSFDACLKESSEGSVDDYFMTRRLAEWRQLLNDFGSNVTEIGQSLHDFVDFAFGDPNDRPARVEEIIEELDSRTQEFSQHIEKAYAALRAETGLFESRRTIVEAQTVTRLTELAFVFIPLTFCCGLFSMQVNELQNGVPLRTFIITAIIVFVICYGARIIMPLSIIVESMQSARESLWAAGKLKAGSQIPTRQLILLMLKEAWKRGGLAPTYLVFLFVLSFTVVPVAFLWTKVHLGSALNVLIMLLLAPMGIAVAWMCATAYTDVQSTSAGDKVLLALRIAFWVSKGIFSRRVNTSTVEFPSDFASPGDSENGDV